jgi:hypothetical protein
LFPEIPAMAAREVIVLIICVTLGPWLLPL